jgi:hypothetical protein
MSNFGWERPRAAAVLLAGFLWAGGSGLLAQQPQQQAPPREVMIGTVVDAAGRPVVGASITLVECDLDLVGLDPVDVVEVRSEAGGRFRAAVQRWTSYTALVAGPTSDGGMAVARPLPWLGSRSLPKLVLDVPAPPRRLRPESLANYGPPESLVVQLRWPSCPGYHVELSFAGATPLELPPLAVVADVVLRHRDGVDLGSLLVPAEVDQAPQVSFSATVPVRAVDAHGKPAANARVVALEARREPGRWFAQSRTSWHLGPVVKTDAAGLAQVVVPHHVDPREAPLDTLLLVAQRDGDAEAVSGWLHQVPFVGWRSIARHATDAPIELPFARVAPRQGRVLGAGLADLRLQVHAVSLVQVERGGATAHYFVPRSHDVMRGADGAYSVPALPAEVGAVRLVVPPLGGRRVITMPTRDGTLPQFDLAACEPLLLQVEDAAGEVGANVDLVLVPTACRSLDVSLAPPLQLDRAGRCEVLLERGAWSVLAVTPTTWALVDLVEWSATKPVVVQMAPMPTCRVRVVDEDQAPVPAARLELGQFRQGIPRDLSGAVLREVGWPGFATQVRRVVTDGDGFATVHLLPWPGTQPTAFAFVGDQRRRSAEAELVAGEDVVTLVIRR